MPQFTDCDILSIKDKIYHYINHIRAGGSIESINTYNPVLTLEQFAIIQKYILARSHIEFCPLAQELHPLINLAQTSHKLDKIKAKKAAAAKKQARASLYTSSFAGYDTYRFEDNWGDGY